MIRLRLVVYLNAILPKPHFDAIYYACGLDGEPPSFVRAGKILNISKQAVQQRCTRAISIVRRHVTTLPELATWLELIEKEHAEPESIYDWEPRRYQSRGLKYIHIK